MASTSSEDKNSFLDRLRSRNKHHSNGSDLSDVEIQAALDSYVQDSEEEKRIVRRIDFILLPILWWMYVLAYLDRGNIVCSYLRHCKRLS
jgi:hypothetical protein